MIIDCHTHIGRNSNIKATASQLIASMDTAKIDKSFVFSGALNDCPIEYVFEQIAPYKNRLYGVFGVHPLTTPTNDVVKELEYIKSLYLDGSIVAVKFYTGYDHFYPNDQILVKYLIMLEEIGCPVIFHCGDCLNTECKAKLKYSHPLGIDDVAVDYPGINFIIAHIGNPYIIDTAEVCYKNKNVFTDISGFVYGDFTYADKVKWRKIINQFLDIASSDKLLFGSDWPISNQKSYIKDTWPINVQESSDNVIKAFKLKI